MHVGLGRTGELADWGLGTIIVPCALLDWDHNGGTNYQ